MGQFYNLNDIANGVNQATPILVPSFGTIQAQNGHPVTETPFLEIPSVTNPLNPMSYEEVKAAEDQMRNEGFLDPYTPQQEQAAAEQNTTPAPQVTSNGSTGDNVADQMIAELSKLDDGTLQGANRMVENFERVAQEYAQRTGRNMQADLFMVRPQRRETDYSLLNPRNF